MEEFAAERQPREIHIWCVIMNNEPEEVEHMQTHHLISDEELLIMRKPRKRPNYNDGDEEIHQDHLSQTVTKMNNNQLPWIPQTEAQEDKTQITGMTIHHHHHQLPTNHQKSKTDLVQSVDH